MPHRQQSIPLPVLQDVKRATLAWYHDGSDYNYVGGGSRRLAGASSPSPQISDNGRGFLARQKVECRTYTSEQRTLALDRVYVFELQ